MLVLLPPSEGKTSPDAGPPVSLETLGMQGLLEARTTVLDAVVAFSALPDAADRLGVPAGRREEVAANVNLRTAPAAPASKVYTGVLYDALGLRTLTPAGRRRASESILTISALWGAVSPADSIPAYRLPMSAALPGLGPLATWWRGQLREELDARAGDNLVVDARSSTYAAAWQPRFRERQVGVRVLTLIDGQERVVSHSAKHTRGLLARHLVSRRGKAPSTPESLLAVAEEMCEDTGPLQEARLTPPPTKTAQWTLDLLLR